MKRLLLPTLLLVVTACGTWRPPASDDFWPMQKGTRWVYERHAEVAGTHVVITNDTTVTCRILETRRTPGYVAARCSSLPTHGDVWSATAESHTPAILLRAGYGQYHILDADDWVEPAVGGESLLIDAPLAVGKRWGDYDTILREDGWYGWRVVSTSRTRIRGIKGVAGWWPRTVHELEYATCPDRQRITFVPGIGIVSYSYHHNGTPADVTLRLVKFERGADD